jgi:DNA polymerase
LDFESFAHRDLRKVGAYEYVACPHFEPTVLAWAFDDGPVQSVTWPNLGTLPAEVEAHLRRGGIFQAWNAAFEWIILTQHYRLPIPHESVSCTMQRALANGLPAALADAGPALGLNIVKDTAARSLMLRMGKPKKDGSLWHATDTAKLMALEAYCQRDVAAEREVGRHLPLLSKFERKVSLIDARSNAVGVQVDDAAVRTLMTAREHVRRLQKNEVVALTNGAVTRIESETANLLNWLQRNWVDISSVDKEAIAGALKETGLPPDVRRVLELRQASARSSLGKLEKMLLVQGSDGRARGLLQYYGAGRTGRWAGRLIQVQNLPRAVEGIDPEGVLEIAAQDPAALDLFWDPLEALTTCLRGCLTAAPGKLLAMIDLSQIEARVLAWLAGQEDVLGVFRSGADVYAYAAGQLGSPDRQLGKVITLAAGYSMGPGRFQETALTYKVVLTAGEAEAAVLGWRQANPKIVAFWWDLERAARPDRDGGAGEAPGARREASHREAG